MLSLNFTKRNKGEVKEGMLKAVYYGKKEKSEAIFIDPIEFTKLYREAGQSSVISLEGDGKKLQAMVQDVSYEPIKYEPIHVDFYIVEKGAKIDAKVPLEFVGVSEGVKTFGGILAKVMHDLHIEADAAHLPHSLEVDLSLLKDENSVILVKDIKLPAGVKLYQVDEEEVVASTSPAVEEDLSVPVEGDISNIEVEEKGKKEDESETESN